jgi:hypothetical protein
MKPHENDHGTGTPVVETVNQPPKRHLQPQVIETAITSVNRWDKVEELPYACDDLKEKNHQNTTAEDIRITGSSRHLFIEAQTNQSVKRPTLINPKQYL